MVLLLVPWGTRPNSLRRFFSSVGADLVMVHTCEVSLEPISEERKSFMPAITVPYSIHPYSEEAVLD